MSIETVGNDKRKVERFPLRNSPNDEKKEVFIYSEKGEISCIELKDSKSTIGVNPGKFIELIEYLNGRKFRNVGILKVSIE